MLRTSDVLAIIAVLALTTSHLSFAQQIEWEKVPIVDEFPVQRLVANDSVIVVGIHGVGVAIREKGGAWRTMSPTSSDPYTTALEFHNGNIYLGTFKGNIYGSPDYGRSWVEYPFSSGHTTVYDIATLGGYIYVGTDIGLYRLNPVTGEHSEVEILPSDSIVTPVFAIHQLNDRLFLGSWGRVFYGDPSKGFHESKYFTDKAILALTAHKKRILASTSGDHIFSTKLKKLRWWKPVGGQRKASINYALLSEGDRLFKGSNGRGVLEDEIETEAGLQRREVLSLCTFDGKLYAGTREHGLYIRDLTKRERKQSLDSRSLAAAVVDGASDSGITIYPNPSSSAIRITADLLGQENVTVKVFDANGKQFYSKSHKPSTVDLDVSEFPSGLYHLLISNGSSARSAPFVVSH